MTSQINIYTITDLRNLDAILRQDQKALHTLSLEQEREKKERGIALGNLTLIEGHKPLHSHLVYNEQGVRVEYQSGLENGYAALTTIPTHTHPHDEIITQIVGVQSNDTAEEILRNTRRIPVGTEHGGTNIGSWLSIHPIKYRFFEQENDKTTGRVTLIYEHNTDNLYTLIQFRLSQNPMNICPLSELEIRMAGQNTITVHEATSIREAIEVASEDAFYDYYGASYERTHKCCITNREDGRLTEDIKQLPAFQGFRAGYMREEVPQIGNRLTQEIVKAFYDQGRTKRELSDSRRSRLLSPGKLF